MDIDLVRGSGGDKVHLGVVDLADGDVVAPAQQLEIDQVFQDMSAVTVTQPQETVAQPDVHDIVFSKSAEVFFSFDVKPFDLIEEVAFQQRIHISLHRVRTWAASALPVLQQPLVGQCVSNGGDRDGGAHVVGQKQNDLAQQRRVCDLTLPTALFPFQNVAHDDRGINTVQQGKGPLLVQAHIGDPRHPTKAQIGVEHFPYLIGFVVLAEYLFAGPAQGAVGHADLKVVKVKEFPEGQGEHFDLDTAA